MLIFTWVTSNEFIMICSGTRSSTVPMFVGKAFKQSGGPYSSSSLSGKMLYDSSISSNGVGASNSSVSIGIVSFPGTPNSLRGL